MHRDQSWLGLRVGWRAGSCSVKILPDVPCTKLVSRPLNHLSGPFLLAVFILCFVLSCILFYFKEGKAASRVQVFFLLKHIDQLWNLCFQVKLSTVTLVNPFSGNTIDWMIDFGLWAITSCSHKLFLVLCSVVPPNSALEIVVRNLTQTSAYKAGSLVCCTLSKTCV